MFNSTDTLTVYSGLVKAIYSSKTLDDLIDVRKAMKTFHHNLPSSYLWMMANLNQMFDSKKQRMVRYYEETRSVKKTKNN